MNKATIYRLISGNVENLSKPLENMKIKFIHAISYISKFLMDRQKRFTQSWFTVFREVRDL